MTETERAELLAASREIEAQDAPVGRLFARLIGHLPGLPAAASDAPAQLLPTPADAQEGAN